MDGVLGNSKIIIINTGNILALNDLTKNPGKNPTEELKEAINITLKDFKSSERIDSNADQPLIVSRQHDDLISKVSEQDLSDLKIGLKVFINSDDENHLKEALHKAFSVLNVGYVQNVIVSYNHNIPQNDYIGKLQNIWRIFETYAESKRIGQIGLADVEEGVFYTIYEWSNIKPSIIQINLATCCVVPPTLQQFCKEGEVQLLTHSDPAELLPTATIRQIFGEELNLNWALRFSVHIKCRGVLTTKGYLISLSK